MIRPVLQLPHSILKIPSVLVEPTMDGLQPFIDDMLETMNHHPRCVGLAAPQLGQSWRVIVVDASRVDKKGSQHGCVVILNPWIGRQLRPRLQREGCLSIPDYTGNVVRADGIEIFGKDRRGKPIEIKAEGFESIVFQHELDHLDGMLFMDRVASLATDVFRRKKYY